MLSFLTVFLLLFFSGCTSCNPSSGETVEHLQWLTESMENTSVLFVVHRTGCIGCKAQADRVIAFAEKYEEQVV
jgi:hypothetical protein